MGGAPTKEKKTMVKCFGFLGFLWFWGCTTFSFSFFFFCCANFRTFHFRVIVFYFCFFFLISSYQIEYLILVLSLIGSLSDNYAFFDEYRISFESFLFEGEINVLLSELRYDNDNNISIAQYSVEIDVTCDDTEFFQILDLFYPSTEIGGEFVSLVCGNSTEEGAIFSGGKKKKKLICNHYKKKFCGF